jgi:SAM-dependent methyltransferase
MPPARPIARLFFRLRHGGLPWLFSTLRDRIWPARPALAPAARAAVRGKAGLEIGGPSGLFSQRGILPVYPDAARIDNVNFASGTAWESGLRDGGDFPFDAARPPGRQYLREATRLEGVADAAYDFILSSHCLEHVANPLAALCEWGRVTRAGGHLLLVLPDAPGTFDHRRPVTALAHLREDFARQTGEDDLTHLTEILAAHDLTRDPAAGTAGEFQARSGRNPENRCLHHHVFDLDLLRAILAETGWEVLGAEKVRPFHLIALARKKATGPGP